MIQKICSKCGGVYSGQECPKCKSTRNKRYNKFDRDSERNAVYQTGAWSSARENVLSRDKGMCRMCYSLYGRIVGGRLTVHHIVPVEEDSDLWYNANNLIAVCHRHHEEIHAAYHRSKPEKERMQSRLRSMFEWE